VGKFSLVRQLGLNFTYVSDAVLERLTTSLGPGVKRNLDTLILSLDGSHLLLVAHMTANGQLATTPGWKAAVTR
jgi:hypothetical protein